MRAVDVALTWGADKVPVGTLVDRNRVIYFEYDAAFLASPLPLSPFKLAAKPGLVEHTDRDFAGVFGVFNDSLPDGWGLLLMDREFRKQGLNPAAVSPLDRLAYIGTRGMGALTYHPPAAAEDDAGLGVDLDAIARQAERILEGSAEDVLPALRIAGARRPVRGPRCWWASRRTGGSSRARRTCRPATATTSSSSTHARTRRTSAPWSSRTPRWRARPA